MGQYSVADQVVAKLCDYLGPHTAKSAVKTFSLRTLGRTPESLTLGDLTELLDALRPMLRTLLGEESATALIGVIQLEMAG